MLVLLLLRDHQAGLVVQEALGRGPRVARPLAFRSLRTPSSNLTGSRPIMTVATILESPQPGHVELDSGEARVLDGIGMEVDGEIEQALVLRKAA